MPTTPSPFDRAMVLENIGGDEELLAQIAALFVADWPANRGRLQQALAAGDAAALRSTAHAIKGAVANFCAEHAVQAARQLELISKTGDLAQAPSHADAVIAAVEEVVTALRGELPA